MISVIQLKLVMYYINPEKLVNVLNSLKILKIINVNMIATNLTFIVLYSDWQALVIMFFEPIPLGGEYDHLRPR
jgi:hypothetical protein